MTTYERITYRPVGATRDRSAILRDPIEVRGKVSDILSTEVE